MKRVLLIEDDPWLAASFARTLRDYEVVSAQTPQQAVAAIDAQIPDVVVCDILLQEGNGFDVITLLAGYTDTYTIPVILLSTIMKDVHSALENYAPFAALDKTTLTPQVLRSSVEAACTR